MLKKKGVGAKQQQPGRFNKKGSIKLESNKQTQPIYALESLKCVSSPPLPSQALLRSAAIDLQGAVTLITKRNTSAKAASEPAYFTPQPCGSEWAPNANASQGRHRRSLMGRAWQPMTTLPSRHPGLGFSPPPCPWGGD